jgi:predicted  nucleic acid-binding Zn-ribbon protein
MNQYAYTLNDVNREALNQTLSQALGAVYGGFADHESNEDVIVTVNLSDAATRADIEQLDTLMAAHDPAQLTEEQQAEQQRRQRLDSLRQARGEALDPDDYSDQDAEIQTLAQKLAWLEQEVIDLRGGSDV